MTQTAEQTAILIDPVTCTVSTVAYDGSLVRFEELTGSDSLHATPVMNAFPGGYLDDDNYWVEGGSALGDYAFEDTILGDDDAMHVDDCHFFRFPLHCDPCAGPVLIAGVDEDGESCAPGITAEQIEPLIQWMGTNAFLPPADPAVRVH